MMKMTLGIWSRPDWQVKNSIRKYLQVAEKQILWKEYDKALFHFARYLQGFFATNAKHEPKRAVLASLSKP